ncbi:MAG: T9SS type A sorting domain-containing protein [Saprospiraceae bacterium]|nr:T9SS type A sorting domain-containing protein [Saprospiraceae bacterium]
MKRVYSLLSGCITVNTLHRTVQIFAVSALIAMLPGSALAQFTSGNVVVLQAGDGTNTLANTGNAVLLKEYTPAGAAGITVTVPSTGPSPMVVAGNATTEGLLTRTPDGTALVFGGYAQALPNATNLTSSASATINRAVGRVSSAGAFTRVATSSTFHTGGNIRGAVSDGSNNYWSVGNGEGTNYFGTTSAAVNVQNVKTNCRGVEVFNGNLYLSTGSGAGAQPNLGIYQIGTGLPVTSGQTITNIINTGTGSSPSEFHFNAAGDVCYIADSRTIATGGGIQKWTFNGSVWSLAYTLGTGTGSTVGAFGLAVDFSGANAVIYASTTEATLNRLIRVVDTGVGATATTLATATTNTIFRGVALAPVCPTISATIVGGGGFCAEGNTSDGTPPLSVTITGGTSPYTVDYTDGLATDYPAISNYVSGTTISHALNFTTTYTLTTVSDANGCPATLAGSATFFVSTTLPEAASTTSAGPTTCGGADGYIVIATTSGGMGPYTYNWTTANGSGIVQGSSFQLALTAGTYTLVITDANGCDSDPIDFVLSDPPGCDVCDITSVTFTNVSGCMNAGTSDPSDDFYTADIVVNFVNPPATGDLQIEPGGDAIGTYSIPVGSLVGNSHTFTGVQFMADGNQTVLEVEFTIPANQCVQTVTNPGVGPCSPVCDITSVTFTNVSGCNGNGTTTPTDDFYTADVVVNFVNPPMPATGNLQIEPGGDAIGTYSIPVASLVGNSHTFTGVQFMADGNQTVVEVEFTVPANQCVQTVTNPGVGPCSFLCPTIGSSTNSTNVICSGANVSITLNSLSNMSQALNGEADFGITFVAYPNALVSPYGSPPGGTLLATVPFASLGGGGTTATLNFVNNLAPGNQFIYAFLTPQPASVACLPFLQIGVQVAPAISIYNVTGSGGSICENGSAGLSIGLSDSDNGITYRLYRDGIANLVATLPGTGNALNFGNFSTAGTYTVVATDNSGASCTATMNGSVVISALPESPAPTVTSPVVYCQNDVATPLTATGVNLLWYTSLADPTGDPVAPTPSTASVGNTSYFVTQTTSGSGAVSTLSPGDIAILGWVDNGTPDVFAFVPFVNLAAGTVIYFTDNGWTGTGFRNTVADGDGNETLTMYVAPSNIAAGTVIYSNGAGFVTSGAIPGAPSGNFQALTLNAGGEQIYAFQNSNSSNPMNNVATMTHLFVFDDTNGFENATDTGTGNIPPGLSAGTTANTFAFSAANLISLNNDGGTRTPAAWLTYIGTSTNYTTATGAVTLSITNLNVTLTGSSLCESDRVEIVVTVNAPATATIPAVQPVCVNSNISLSVTLGGSAMSGTWSASVAGGSFAPNNTSTSVTYTPPANFSGFITFTFTTNDPAGPCPAGVATRMVEVQTGGVNAGPDQLICSGQTASLNGVLTTGATTPANWSASVPGGTFANAGNVVTTYTPPVGFTGNITLTLTATGTGACAIPQDQLVLSVNPVPVAPSVTTPVVYCQNAPAVPLTATGNDLLWYTSLADLIGDPVAPTPSTAMVGNTSYYVTQTANVTPGVSVLAPGDIAIIAFKDDPDNFAFVPFVNLAAGTVIYFTDNGWTGTDFRGATATVGRGNEDIMRYTVPAGGVMAGTVIVMSTGSTLTPGFAAAGTAIPGTNGNGNNQFQVLQFNGANGDQIYAFQNTNANNPLFNVATMTHLFVFDDTNGFEAAGSASTGAIPPGLTLGTTAITFNFILNNTSQLINDGATRTPAQWLAYIANAANYAQSADMATTISIADLNIPGACESPRAEIVVTVNPSPAIFTVTGGGEVCTTDNIGVAIGLSGSESNVSYQLLLNGNPINAPVQGTGNPISFGTHLTVGTYTVTATATPGNCTAPMMGSAVVSDFDCFAEISDPCNCLNNATTLTNGQFGEQIKVTAPGTQTWTVTAVSGLYRANSPNPPASPSPITVGTVLVNIGGNMFTLDGRHVDALGYTITVSNGLGTTFNLANSCEYPNPSITSDLSGPFCLYSDPITLTGDPGDDVLNPNVDPFFTVKFNNGPAVVSTVFDPSNGLGTYVITYTVDGGEPKAAGEDDPGCVQSVSQTVQVVATPSNLVCNDLVTVSLPASCTVDILPDMVLEGSYPCFDDYEVTIDRILPLGNGPWAPGVINQDDIGHTYAVRVTHLVSGNSCWGQLKVEDKLPPVMTCTDFNLNCNIPSNTPDYLTANGIVPFIQAYPVVVDCQGFDLTYKDVATDEDCASGYTKTIVRTWTAVDHSGNKATCSQTIHFLRPTMMDVVLPENYDNLQAPALPCSSAYPSPEYLNGIGLQGTPTVFGQPDGCNIGWGYTDERIDVCEGTYKVIRHWTLVDWCTNQTQHYNQLIKVLDDDGPTFDPIPNMAVSTNPSQCCANVNLPDVIISDNCSRINNISAMVIVYDQYLTDQVIGTYTVTNNTLTTFPGNNFWDRDTLANFGTTPCLPIGIHQVMYAAEDACGNKTTATFRLTVRDETPPVATCTQFTTVAIDGDDPTDCYEPDGANQFGGVAWVPASAFNQGSHDNCNGMEFTIRRMSNGGSYGECIDNLSSLCDGNEYFTATSENDSIKFYCCEIGTTQTVIFRVYQLDINGQRDYYRNLDGTPLILPGSGIQYIYNECMVNVEVQDKIKPTCEPPAHVTINCENFDPTLWAYGFAESVDNCCVDTITVSSNYTQFDTTCNRGTILRTFRAYDCVGLSSSCTQRITVTYSQNYYLRLPDDKTVYACNGAPNSFGYPTFYGEDCELLGVAYNDVIFTVVPDACYKIERTWTIINWCTYVPGSPCVDVPNPNPSFVANDPANVRAPILSPPNTPAPWAPTIIKINPSDPAPTNYSSFWNPDANCYRYKQIVKVIDTQDPVFDGCPDTLVKVCDYSTNDALLWNQEYWWDNTLQTHDLCEGPADLTVSALDSCSGTTLRFRYLLFLDLDGDGVQETVVSSANPPEPGTVRYNNINTPNYGGGEVRQFQPNLPLNQRSRFVVLENYSSDATHLLGHLRFNTIQSPTVYTVPQLPHGRHRIEWIAEDLCGNETICKYDFEIRDCKPPVVACANVNINLMVGGMATLWANDFFLYGEDNCTPTNILNQSLAIVRADENPSNTYPGGAPANQSVVVTCLDEGQDVPVQVWLQDAAGNYDYCTAYVNVQANVVGCENFTPSAAVAGQLSVDGQGVEQASVELAGTQNVNAIDITDDNGAYHFAGVPLLADLTITPTKDDNPLNGVSTYDLVLITKHILGLEPLTTPYKMIAADANRSGSITTFDIVEFRKLILGIYTDLPNNTSWRFVDKAYTFPTPANPFQPQFPENISIDNLFGNMLQNNFEAVKIGDVNGTAIANSLQSAEERTASTMLFDVEDRAVKAGETFTVNFKGTERVQGYQFTMNFNGLEVMDIAGNGDIKAENFGVFQDALTTSVDGSDNEFAVTFRASKTGQLSSMLGVSSRITKAEAYPLPTSPNGGGVSRMDVALRFNNNGTSTISGVGFELYQNQPNPFVNKTFIGFHLPEATDATLRIFDETGRMVFTQSGSFAKGYNTIPVDRQLLNTTGVLYYTLETATDSATKKMIQSK